MEAYTPVTHVIFDLDGLLLDTETIYKRIIEGIATNYGKVYTQDVREMILGTQTNDSARIIVQQLELPITPEEWILEYDTMCTNALRNPSLMPGAEKLIRHLHKNQIPIAVATSSAADMVAIKLENHKELFALFNHIVMGSSDSEVKHGKPAPDIFQVAASRFKGKPDPEQVLVFEDAPNGIEGARAAGMQAVMIPDPELSEEKRQRATLVLNSLEDFKPELFGLPPYR